MKETLLYAHRDKTHMPMENFNLTEEELLKIPRNHSAFLDIIVCLMKNTTGPIH
jgi:hypothetical protein